MDLRENATTMSLDGRSGGAPIPGLDDHRLRTGRQDWAACESVQRGMASVRYVPGPLAPDEDGVHRFVMMVARKYLGR
ncbi:SRPBCC family protein [Cryptosporangium sp. NPDC048952]|uniref:SRPBCC family protein n=1 Tax=Cryptosporangium sp. NPDC048952 TaxID=3363961 RepID=UPI0037106DC4